MITSPEVPVVSPSETATFTTNPNCSVSDDPFLEALMAETGCEISPKATASTCGGGGGSPETQAGQLGQLGSVRPKTPSIAPEGRFPNLTYLTEDLKNNIIKEEDTYIGPPIASIESYEDTLVRLGSVRNSDSAVAPPRPYGEEAVVDGQGEAATVGNGGQVGFPDVKEVRNSEGEVVKTIFLKTENNFEALANRLGYTFWYDENTWETKVDRNGVPLDRHLDYIQTELQSDLERVGIHGVAHRDVGRWIYYIAQKNRRNPFKEWMSAIPHTWEGTPYLDAWCDSVHQEAGSITDDMKNLILKRHVVGTVGLQFDKHPNHPYAVMFLGPQGVFKGQKLHELFTGDRFGSATWARFDRTNFDPKNRDCMKEMMTCAMLELAEMESIRKMEQGALKAALSQQEFTHTDKYSNNPIKVPRRTSMWITGNFDEALADSSGARRFLPIAIKEMSFDYPDGFSIQKVWADAIHLHSKQFRTYFDNVEEVELYSHKASFTTSTSIDLLFESYFKVDTPIEKWELMPFHTIAAYLNLDLSRANTRQIGASLRKIAKNPTLKSEQKWSVGGNVRQILCPPPKLPEPPEMPDWHGKIFLGGKL